MSATNSFIYSALAEHQQSATEWSLREVAGELRRWEETFRLKFKLQIPVAALRLSPLPVTRLGHYFCGFNAFGLKNEIAISLQHVQRSRAPDQWWRVLGTLLHEQLHLWQQIHGKPGRRNYHNVQYQRRAAGFGLIVDGGGHTQYAAQSRFMDLLREFGVRVPQLTDPVIADLGGRARGNSKLKKWSCSCQPPINVRVAIPDFEALCLKCRRVFRKQE